MLEVGDQTYEKQKKIIIYILIKILLFSHKLSSVSAITPNYICHYTKLYLPFKTPKYINTPKWIYNYTKVYLPLHQSVFAITPKCICLCPQVYLQILANMILLICSMSLKYILRHFNLFGTLVLQYTLFVKSKCNFMFESKGCQLKKDTV